MAFNAKPAGVLFDLDGTLLDTAPVMRVMRTAMSGVPKVTNSAPP